MPVVSHKSPLLWTRGVAARETLSYLDRRGIDAEPALFEAGLSRRQLSRDDIGLSVASQYRFLELAATEANDQLLGLHVAAEMDMRAIGILFYLTGSSRTVSEALENLAHYTATAPGPPPAPQRTPGGMSVLPRANGLQSQIRSWFIP
jgi:hypothetical protein